MRAIVIAGAVLAAIAGRATADDELKGPWFARPGAVICASYFAMQDGEAAARSGDDKWLSDTGCAAAKPSWQITSLIDGKLNEPFGILRVRVTGPAGAASLYIRGRNIVRQSATGWQSLPCARAGGWRCDY